MQASEALRTTPTPHPPHSSMTSRASQEVNTLTDEGKGEVLKEGEKKRTEERKGAGLA